MKVESSDDVLIVDTSQPTKAVSIQDVATSIKQLLLRQGVDAVTLIVAHNAIEFKVNHHSEVEPDGKEN